MIDFYDSGGSASLPECAKLLKDKPYVYGRHVAPHDIRVRELASGRSRLETAASLGIPFDIAPNVAIEDGITASKLVFPRCWFDSAKCEPGLESLRNYRRDFNARLHEFKDAPLHNWASHGADAFRYLAVSHETPTAKREQAWPAPVSGSAGPMAWGY